MTVRSGMLSRRAFEALAAGAFAGAWLSSRAAADAPRSKSSGFSKAGLASVDAAMRKHVDGGAIPGMVTLLASHDQVHVNAIGVQDLNTRAPMQRDTIFRIASMTKPVTAAAAMILVDEGKVRLDDPVERWLPELANRKVLRSLASPLDDTVPARRAITVRDLATLRLGFGMIMEQPGKYPIQKAIADAELAPGPKLFDHSPDEFMKRLGNLPLIHQPGEQWMYHTGLDVLGVLISRAAGMSLSSFLEQRIFAPLGMQDTGFSVPKTTLSRLATGYGADPATGKLSAWDEARTGQWSRPPAFEAGGGGLVSKADDFLAFARMMLDHGVLGSKRILSQRSVESMITDQITPAQKKASVFFPGFWDTHGWGLGLSMTTAPDDISKVPGRYGWDGGYGTTYSADPREDMVAILLTQRLMQGPNDAAINAEFLKLAYQALA